MAFRWAPLLLALAVSPAARAEWKPLPPPAGMEGGCKHLFFLPSGFGALIDDKQQLFVSRDEGDSWSPRALPAIEGIRMRLSSWADERTGLVAGSRESGAGALLFRTEDGGTTWTPVALELLTPDGQPAWTQAVSFATPDVVGFFGGFQGASPRAIAARSVDGGRTFKEVALPCRGPVRFAGEKGGVLLGVCGAHYTRDGGATWSKAQGDLRTDGSTVDDVYFVDPLTALAVGYSQQWHTEDGGASWTMDRGGYLSYQPAYVLRGSRDSLFGSAEARDMFRSKDLGKTWERDRLPESVRGAGDTHCLAHPRPGLFLVGTGSWRPFYRDRTSPTPDAAVSGEDAGGPADPAAAADVSPDGVDASSNGGETSPGATDAAALLPDATAAPIERDGPDAIDAAAAIALGAGRGCSCTLGNATGSSLPALAGLFALALLWRARRRH